MTSLHRERYTLTLSRAEQRRLRRSSRITMSAAFLKTCSLN
ncbi:hypothetical protein PO124_25825 [Bacillus licheniformis]|nr:hypothetical protein [Bacillus licheniformis]